MHIIKPMFKRQTGFIVSGALCMELLTKDGWNPTNDIKSIIVSICSLMVMGDGRLQAAVNMPEGGLCEGSEERVGEEQAAEEGGQR